MRDLRSKSLTLPTLAHTLFAIALAREFGCALVTGDPEIRAPANDGLVEVEWLRTF